MRVSRVRGVSFQHPACPSEGVSCVVRRVLSQPPCSASPVAVVRRQSRTSSTVTLPQVHNRTIR